MIYLREMSGRLARAWVWIAAQFVGTLLLILLGLAWTRLPDKHLWQVALSLLVPLLLAAAALALQAGTMRRLMEGERATVGLAWGVLMLLVWAAVAFVAWALLDWCDNRIPDWAGYLNSQASAHWRATIFTYLHLLRWLSLAEWILRWIVVPGKLILYALASVQWGWRLPWRKLIHLLLNWRWWPAVVLAALVGVAWPGTFFDGMPHGAVSHQVWAVVLKLVIAYLLAMSSWVLLLGWGATLLDHECGDRDGSKSGTMPLRLAEDGDDFAGNA